MDGATDQATPADDPARPIINVTPDEFALFLEEVLGNAPPGANGAITTKHSARGTALESADGTKRSRL